MENELISLEKIEIPLKNMVPKLALCSSSIQLLPNVSTGGNGLQFKCLFTIRLNS
jgi:hypothetical protein